MSKIKIEIQITILAIIIATAVVISGYLVYNSLSNIVDSVHQEALPNNRLFGMKEIASDLSNIENNIRLFILTGNEQHLNSNDTLHQKISSNLHDFYNSTPPTSHDRAVVDTFQLLVEKKKELWQSVLTLNTTAKEVQPEFSEIYSWIEIDKKQYDTIKVEAPQKGFLSKLRRNKKMVIVDTILVERGLDKKELRQEIETLQTEIITKGQQANLLESNIITENRLVTDKINRLIKTAEINESESLLQKTVEADRLAALTYKRLSAFTITAISLLFVVLYLLYNYLRKARAYEKGLKISREKAEELANAKEKFAANVSHELRTPVNAIHGLTEQLLSRKNNEDLDKNIIVLSKSAAYLSHIINDTLDFSKIQADKLKFDSVHFSPNKVFKEVIDLQIFNANKKGIELVLKVAKDFPEALIGDPLRLQQILINLIGNSIKFTSEGQVLIETNVSNVEDEVINLNFMVKDTGIGISENNLKIIFDEFVQANNSDGTKINGTGLGLAIVKKLVELQQGNILIESELGIGTTVKVSIPYQLGNKERIIEQLSETPKIPAFFSSLSILIADDDEFNRLLVKGILKKWNVDYAEAYNGEIAVELSKNNHFDVILMDMRMPELNGIDATKEILKYKPHSKIIALTATNRNSEKKECLEAGMLGFLMKPFSESILFETINSVVNFKNL